MLLLLLLLLLELEDVVGRLGLLLLGSTERQHLTPHRHTLRLDNGGLRGQLLLGGVNQGLRGH